MRNTSPVSLLTLVLSLLGLTLNAQTTTGLQLWLKPEGITNTVAASPISFWTDSSSGSYHATNPAAGRQPTYTASALNGYPVAHFTGDGVGAANNFLQSPLPYNASTNPFTTVIVYKPDFVGSRAQLVHQIGGYAMLYLLPNSSPLKTNLISNASGQLITNSVSNDKNWKIVTLVEDATSIKMYENGVLVGSTGFTIPAVATSGGGFVFGARQNKTAFGFNGDIAEIMVYTNALTSAQQWTTENYLATKYTNAAAIANLHDAYAVSTGAWSNTATWSTAGNIVTPADVFMSSNGLTVSITDGGAYSVVGNNTNNIDFVIGQGDNVYNGIVNMYGGTVWDHKGPFGNGILTITNGSLTTGGKIFGIAFRAGSTGTLNLSGTGSLTVTNIDFFAGWDGGNGVINLADSSALTLNSTTGNQRIGWGGASVATMNYTQSGGTLTAQNFLYFGGAGSGLTTTANVSGGSIVSLGNMLVGHNDALQTTFNQSGSSAVSVASGNALYLGNLNAKATYNLSAGSLTCNSWLILAPNGTAAVGTFNQSGGTATVAELDLGASGGVNGKAIYNLNGGTLSVSAIVSYAGLQAGSGIRLGGGTLQASGAQSWANTFYGVNGSTSTIDVQGFAVTASQIVSNTAGATFTINKTGAATLTLSGTADNTGFTLNVQNGTALLAKTSSASVHAANNVTVQSGATAQLGGTGGDQIGNSGTLAILGTGALNLNGLNETVNALTISGANKAAGTWGATGSGAANIDNTHFSGAGLLTVLTGPAPTTLALTASANPSQLGASVTFTATIQTNGITAIGTSGQVIFSLGITPLSTNSLSSGVASFSTSALPAGTNVITAAYAGDNNYLGSSNSLNQVVNRPPTAQSIATSVASGDAVAVLIIGGKFAPTDPDGDSMTVAAVSGPIIGGGVASVSGGTGFTYLATNAVVGVNTFTYTVSDGRGGSDTKTVTVTVLAASGGANITSLSVGGSVVTVNALGLPGAIYSLQYSDSLSPVSWQDAFVTNTAAANGQITLSNTPATLPPVRYYRTKYISGP